MKRKTRLSTCQLLIGLELARPLAEILPLNSAEETRQFRRSNMSNRGQEESFAQLHAVIISLLTTVGGYVQFQFQSKNLSLFDEHGNTMRAAFVMLFLYVMGFMAELKLQNRSNYLAINKQFTPLFGLLAVVLLLFILSLFLGLAASIIWAFLVVGPTIRLFQQIIQWFHGIVLYIRTNHTATSNFDMEENDSIGIKENGLPV